MIARDLTPFSFSRVLAITTFGLMTLAAVDISSQLDALGIPFSLKTFWWPFVIVTLLVSIAGFIFVFSDRFQSTVNWFFERYHDQAPNYKHLLMGIFLFLSLGYSIWVLKIGYIVLNGFRTRLFLFGVISILGMLCLKPFTHDCRWIPALVGAILVTVFFFKVMIYAFQGISTSPFSLSWSEGSRYYYASLFFSESLYDMNLPLSPLHPSRYLLLALPFSLPGLPIWVHRTWQVLLWIGLATLAGMLLAKRLKLRNRFLVIGFFAWVYLFLNLGPVYYHLMICVILIYWGVDFKKPRRTLVILILASIWAGLSRVNWLPVPAFLVVTLYFLEQSWDRTKPWWRYLVQPAVWSFSILAAVLASTLYIPLSGNVANKFGSTFTSDLLWYRLWPNPTYPLGIVMGTVAVSAPLWLVIYMAHQRIGHYVHPVKRLGFVGMLGILFLGGLVVSVKIGGGSNLHNMDAYFVLLMTIASYVFWGKSVVDTGSVDRKREISTPGWITAVALLIPVLLVLREGGVISTPDPGKDQVDLRTLQKLVSEVSDNGGEILFIAERQLQVFNLVPEIRLVSDYEKIELMEMAMAGNEDYLERFYEDVSNQKFALIITDTVQTGMKGKADAFPEEHNVWVERVTIPLIAHYDSNSLGGRSNIYILTPK